jgi:uridine kinase
MSQRQRVLQHVADRILALPSDHVVMAGIDGVDGAGKTTFADELAVVLRSAHRAIIRAGTDGFHNPRAVRYRRGRGSPEGYFEDSYDYAGLEAALLHPLSPGGSGRYRTAIFDHRTDAAAVTPVLQASPDAILVFDGIFLHRPELREHWDFSVYLKTDFAVSVARCAERDGASPNPADATNHRYVEGQRLYLRSCSPWARASLVIDNNDLAAPILVEGSC